MVVALVVALLPALVAYRYTSPVQRDDFVSHPWRGWSFVAAALRVPGDSELKTSGDALRKAEWLFKGTADRPAGGPAPVRHRRRALRISTQEVAGVQRRRRGHAELPVHLGGARHRADAAGGAAAEPEVAVVALLDYETGRLLYDVRDDLPATSPAPSATPSPAPSTTAP